MISRSSYLTTRAALVTVVAVCAASVTCARLLPGERSVESLTQTLARASEREVESFHWEPARSVWSEWLWGRPVLFEGREPHPSRGECADRLAHRAAPHTDAPLPRDIYRAFVRLTPSGAPLEVRSVRNLTQTCLADETGLTVGSRLALYATASEGKLHSLTFLHLEGESARTELPFFSRVRESLSRLLRTGDLRGFGRSDLLLPAPSPRLNAEEREGELEISWGKAQLVLPLDALGSGSELSHETLTNIERAGLKLTTRRTEPAPFLHWAANTGRLLVGPRPIAWVEGQVFAALDRYHRLRHSFARREPVEELEPALNALPERVTNNDAVHEWPPQALPPFLSGARPEEGRWQPLTAPFLPAEAKEAPYLYRTALRPDPERPYAEVVLVAIDTTRLDLGVRAGYEDPHPETGPPGSGHVPEDPAQYERIVATFNGAFKAVHGAYGMQAEGRLLVPPSAEAATVRIDRDGRVGIGAWPKREDDSTAAAPESFPSLVAFRQNLDLLVEAGRPNPTGRKAWGDHLIGNFITAERSALCVTKAGHLIYAWSPEISAEALAASLVHAGCENAIHLDMNPGHCAFSLHNVTRFQPLVAEGTNLDVRMKVNPNRYLRWSPKDFFYLARRPAAPVTSSLRWELAPGDQPELPLSLGRHDAGGVQIEIDRFAIDSLELSVWAGSAETKRPLVQTEDSEILVSWGLGHKTVGTRSGLLHGKETLIPLHRASASLRLATGKPPELLQPGVPSVPEEGVQVVQLPLLAREGALEPLARELGDRRARGALCIDPTGHVLIGRLEHDNSAPLVQALLELGCEDIAALDRGSHHPAFVQRRGVASEARLDASESRLVGRARILRPRAYAWSTRAAAEQ